MIVRIFFCLLVSGSAWAQSPMRDVNYYFDSQKLSYVKDPFHLMRAFVDYYYLLVKENRADLKTLDTTWNTTGWCVGDAHPENFGFLIQENGQAVFTMNDIDDSGPCPMVVDILHLMVTARLFDASFPIAKIVEAYDLGLQGQANSMPWFLKDLQQKSEKRGTAISDKQVKNGKIIRGKKDREVTDDERSAITKVLQYIPGTQILDIIGSEKLNGGSAGQQRFIVLFDDQGTQVLVQLKEQVQPAIYPVAPGPIPATYERVMKTLTLDQGSQLSRYYNVVTLGSKEMFVRPLFSGNLSVDLGNQSDSDNQDLIRYEAYWLGHFHAEAAENRGWLRLNWPQQLNAVPGAIWEADVARIASQFEYKFHQLK